MNWILFAFTVAAVQGLVLASAFLSAWRHRRKFFLGLYLFFFSVTILHYVAYWHGELNLPEAIRWFGSGVSWLMPAAFYLCLKDEKPGLRSLMHLLPWAGFTGYRVMASSGWIPPEQLQVNAPYIGFLKVMLFAAYGVAAGRIALKTWLSRILSWGYYSVAGGLLLYWLSVSLGFYTVNFDYLISAFFVLFTYAVTYLSQREFLIRQVAGSKYASSSLTEEDGLRIVKRVHEIMGHEKCYREKSFNLESLAAKLHVPKYQVSQALNSYSRESFSEILNRYRVEEAREKLHSPAYRHLTIEAIGEEVGFSNKVSFYKHFRKLYGMAPGAFQRSRREAGFADLSSAE